MNNEKLLSVLGSMADQTSTPGWWIYATWLLILVAVVTLVWWIRPYLGKLGELTAIKEKIETITFSEQSIIT